MRTYNAATTGRTANGLLTASTEATASKGDCLRLPFGSLARVEYLLHRCNSTGINTYVVIPPSQGNLFPVPRLFPLAQP